MERQGVAIDQLLIYRGYITSGLVDDVLGRLGVQGWAALRQSDLKLSL